MPQDNSTVGVYATLSAAEGAVRKLDEGKFPIRQISVVAKDLQDEKKVHGYVTACDVSKSGAKTGAWVGGLFGVLVGAAFVWIPGVGPAVIAGSLSSMLLGGIEGAVAGSAMGGILAGLSAWGISKQQIIKYEERVKAGSYLVIAHGSPEEAAQARNLLQDSGAMELNLHSTAA
jgi:predicted phage tail protein